MESIRARLDRLSDELRDENGEKAYTIPNGGSNNIGAFGYIEGFQELINQGLLHDFDDLVMAFGSGCTAAGIAISNYLTGSRIRCHAVCIDDNANDFYKLMDYKLEGFGLTDVKACDICGLIDGHHSLSTEEELEQLIEIAQSTGIILDPVYTLKAARGMLLEMKNNPSRFKGRRVLFLHTGGLYALFDGRVEPLLFGGKKTQNGQLKIWRNVQDNPLTLEWQN